MPTIKLTVPQGAWTGLIKGRRRFCPQPLTKDEKAKLVERFTNTLNEVA